MIIHQIFFKDAIKALCPSVCEQLFLYQFYSTTLSLCRSPENVNEAYSTTPTLALQTLISGMVF